MKKLISIILASMLLISVFAFSANAAEGRVSVRIEGASASIYNGEVSLDITEDTTVADVLTALVNENTDISIVGIEASYITEINGEKADQFSEPNDFIYDGWYYALNDTVPSLGIGSAAVKNGDSIVLFYGDYPCQYPVMNTDLFVDGLIRFESYDYVDGYADEEAGWISVYDWCPVENAEVTIGDKQYTTNAKGAVLVNPDEFDGFTNVQISKTSAIGAPAVCRFPSDFGFDAAKLREEAQKPAPTADFTFKNTLYVKGAYAIDFAGDAAVEYTSSNKSVAKVSSKGVITAVKAGKATVTAKVGNFSAKYVVTVKNPKLNAEKKTLKKGKSFALKVSGLVGKAKFKSDKKNIASVNSAGKITAKKKGTATIKVTANGITLKCKVKVQ